MAKSAASKADALAAAADANHPNNNDSQLELAWRSLILHRPLIEDVLATLGSTLTVDDTTSAYLHARIARCLEASNANASLLERTAVAAGAPSLNTRAGGGSDDLEIDPAMLAAAAKNLPKVTRALRLLACDWSTSGMSWRSTLYNPIIDAVASAIEDSAHNDIHGDDDEDDGTFKVLVPGASLGRLAWELASQNPRVIVQGCESNYIELFLANFALNFLDADTVFPHALRVDGNSVEEGEEIPDTNPAKANIENLSMCAGEFSALYGTDETEAWNAVVTCRYLSESCHRNNNTNIVDDIRRIYRVLKVGGVWINHGSFDTNSNTNNEEEEDRNIILCEEELFRIIPRLGFKIVSREKRKMKNYSTAEDNIVDEDECVFFVAVKI